jgi:predicted NAD/FAD-dependent oxidoreductase
VTNGDSFIDLSFRGVAQRASATPRSKIEEFAREYQKSQLTFVSDTEAQVETKTVVVKVVRETDEWKVDGTDGMKKTLLASLPLSPESKQRLEKF